jgi:Tol biopolymer transport system component
MATDRIQTSLFAPNSRAIVYVGAQETSGRPEVFFVNLSTGSPSPWRKLNRALGTDGAVSATPGHFAWSADSSRVAYLASEGGLNGLGVNLLVANVLSETQARPVTGAALGCLTPDSCKSVVGFVFQP